MSREEMLKQPNGAAISHIHSKGEQNGKFVYEVVLPHRIRLLERPLAIVRMSDLEASRATLEPAGKEPGQSVRTLAGDIVNYVVWNGDTGTTHDGMSNQIASLIQSHVDQQTRELREALAHIEVLATMGCGPGGFPHDMTDTKRLHLIADEARAALSTGNNLEAE